MSGNLNNRKNLLSLLQMGVYTTIRVLFPPYKDEDKHYVYKVHNTLLDKVQIDGHVVVEVTNGGKLQLTVAKVVEVHTVPQLDLSIEGTYRFIVSIVDRTLYDQLVEQQKEFDMAMVDLERMREHDSLVRDFQKGLSLTKGSPAEQLMHHIMNKYNLTLPPPDANAPIDSEGTFEPIVSPLDLDARVKAWRLGQGRGITNWNTLNEVQQKQWHQDYEETHYAMSADDALLKDVRQYRERMEPHSQTLWNDLTPQKRREWIETYAKFAMELQ